MLGNRCDRSYLTRVFFIFLALVLFLPNLHWAKGPSSSQRQGITLDFSDVELPVLVRFISELTGKNFVLDEKVKGKISLFSPSKVSRTEAFRIFLSALQLKGYKVIPRGHVFQIVQVHQAPPEREIFVIKLKNADVEETSKTLTNLVAPSLKKKPVFPDQQPVTQAEEFEAPIQIHPDAPTNALIITATKRDYRRLKPIVQSMDIRRHQVYVEGVILEIAVDRLRELGTDPTALSVFKENSVAGIIGVNTEPLSTLATISGAFTGLDPGLVSLSKLNLRAFLKVLLTATDSNILATPQVLTLDNVKAKISVGENRPFVTGSGTVGATGSILTTVERRDVGVTLEITPHLLEDDMIRLEVIQEITAVLPIPQTVGNDVAVGPTTTKRSATTTIMAQNGETVALGGLIREDVTIDKTKIPLLGDIPLLGWLFKSENTTKTKLNLLLFLTPTIIKQPAQMQELVEGQRKRLNLLPETTSEGSDLSQVQ